MTLSGKLVLVIAVVFILGLSVSVLAIQVDHSEDYLWGDLVTTEHGLACNSVVDLENGVYTYSYTLIYTAGIGDIHIFDIENPNGSAFFGAENQPVLGQFGNPQDGSAGWLEWLNGTIKVGESRTFSYKSIYAPMEIEVWTYVVNGGTSAVGTTLGMGNMIPEPSSFAALLFGAAGLLPVVLKRRK